MRSATARGGCAICSAAWDTTSELYALTIDDGPRGRGAAVRRSGAAARRRHDLPFRPAVSDDRGVRELARGRPRPAVSQRHAGRVLRAVRSGPVPPGSRSPARNWRRWSDASISRSASPSTTGSELEALGFAPTGVLPLAIDLSRITRPVERPALDKILDDDFVNFLFVGRIAPNKKIEDHIRLAEHYKRYVDAYYRFIFVGRYDAVPRYYSTIRALMAEYRLLDERFVFTGPVPDEDLAIYYRQRRRLHLAERARRLLRAAASRRWPPTCLSWPTRRPRCRKRSAAPACSSRRRISSTPPSSPARSRSTTTCARR